MIEKYDKDKHDKELNLTNYFSDGVYLRVITIPADTFIVGHKHLTNHLNILLTGSMDIQIAGERRYIEAPYIFEALAGSIKMAKTYSECKFANIIPSNTRDIQEIESRVLDENFVPTHSEVLLEQAKIGGLLL